MSGIFSDSHCWERDRQKRFKDTQSVLPALLDLESKSLHMRFHKVLISALFLAPDVFPMGGIIQNHDIPTFSTQTGRIIENKSQCGHSEEAYSRFHLYESTDLRRWVSFFMTVHTTAEEKRL